MEYLKSSYHKIFLSIILIWTWFLLKNSDLRFSNYDFLIILKMKLVDGLDLEDRHCTSCHLLEDEFHFVLECARCRNKTICNLDIAI